MSKKIEPKYMPALRTVGGIVGVIRSCVQIDQSRGLNGLDFKTALRLARRLEAAYRELWLELAQVPEQAPEAEER